MTTADQQNNAGILDVFSKLSDALEAHDTGAGAFRSIVIAAVPVSGEVGEDVVWIAEHEDDTIALLAALNRAAATLLGV